MVVNKSDVWGMFPSLCILSVINLCDEPHLSFALSDLRAVDKEETFVDVPFREVERSQNLLDCRAVRTLMSP